jgi:hypothetical protein
MPDMTEEESQYWDDVERGEGIAAEHMAKVDAENVEWKKKWSNYCTACSGWGGHTFHESHGDRYAPPETLFDICGALEPTQCHRCKEHGLSEDSEGPCKFCGWNFDNGLKEY